MGYRPGRREVLDTTEPLDTAQLILTVSPLHPLAHSPIQVFHIFSSLHITNIFSAIMTLSY